MSQNAIVLPTTGTQSGLTIVQDVNQALDSLATNFSGNAAPANPQAGQFWVDTSVAGAFVLKQRNSANTAWTTIGKIDLPNLGAAQRIGDVFTGDVTVPSLNSGQLAGMRNRIINGDMRFNQRGISAVGSGVGGFFNALDRWIVLAQGAAVTVNQGAVSAPDGSTSSLKITGAAGNTNTSFIQRIESVNLADLVNKQVTFSAYLFTTGGAVTPSFLLKTPNAVDNYTGTTVVTTPALQSVPQNTWTKVSCTVTLPAAAANGLQVEIIVNATAAGVDWHMTSAQLEPGAVATPVERRSHSVELTLCQRYYEKSYNIGQAPGAVSGAGREEEFRNQTTGILQYGAVRFKVSKRTTPTITIFNDTSGNNGSGTQNDGSAVAITSSNVGENGFRTNWTNGVGLFGAAYHWTANSEL